MNKPSRIFLFFYFLVIFFFAISIYKNVFSFYKGGQFPLIVFNFLQRLSGALALFLLFVQIIFGAYRPRLSSIFGNWVLNFHIWQGRLAYFLVLLHTFSFVFLNLIARKTFNLFYVFVDFCVLCPTKKELFYSFGRFSFYILTITILAAVLRSKSWWRKNWRYVHSLNYVLFFLIAPHTFFIGSDFSYKSGYLFYFLLTFSIITFLVLIQKVIVWFKSSFRLK